MTSDSSFGRKDAPQHRVAAPGPRDFHLRFQDCLRACEERKESSELSLHSEESATPDLANPLPAIIRADENLPIPLPCLPYGRRARGSVPRCRADETRATTGRAR